VSRKGWSECYRHEVFREAYEFKPPPNESYPVKKAFKCMKIGQQSMEPPKPQAMGVFRGVYSIKPQMISLLLKTKLYSKIWSNSMQSPKCNP